MGTVIDFEQAKRKKQMTDRRSAQIDWKKKLHGEEQDTVKKPKLRRGYHPYDKTEGVTAEYYQAVDHLQKYAIKAFVKTLAGFRRGDRVRLPDDFEQIMRQPRGRLPEATRRKLAALPPERKQELRLAMVTAVHDGWVRDNSQFFFDSQYANQRFLFLPIELCGMHAYREFLGMITPLLERLELDLWLNRDTATEEEYSKQRHKFVRMHGLTNGNLPEYIANCGDEYVAMNPEISATLKYDPVLATELTSQVALRAPLGGIEYC